MPDITLKQSMEMAGQCCLDWLDPEKNFMPTGGYEVAHDTGRWWDAMLRLEDAAGFVIPEHLEDAMMSNLKTLTDNPDGLLMNNPNVPWLKPMINPHNFREAMIAFNALVRYRNSEWAKKAGHKLLETMDKSFKSDGRFDYTKLESYGKIPHTSDPCHNQPEDTWFDATANSGRSLEGIVWFYEATGDDLAIRLAHRIARHHMKNTVNKDGSTREEIISPENVGHNHSYLGTLRGLLLFGLLTQQWEYVDVVEATYRNGLWKNNISESGWTPHDLGKTRFPNNDGDPVAETASCGDVVQLGLWLALHCGNVELLDDVERLMRSRILPAQIKEDDMKHFGNLDERNQKKRLGAWGVHGDPYGKGSIHDVLAAVLHTTVDVYNSIITRSPFGITINFSLDYSDSLATIESRRDESAEIIIRPKIQDNVMIRIPQWTSEDTISITINGKNYPKLRIGPWLHAPRDEVKPGSEIVIRYNLPERIGTEIMPSGKTYKLKWKGDEVTVISPHESPLCIYNPM
ncbi:hypothetical protein GF312_20835 [Candidatus Poribacteria bacterium]|nr:hypothetical protein [Candidatus Poribacteria bacterium]